MREIKFRAWDKLRKEMINYNSGEFSLMPFSNLYNKQFREVYTFMQYTGLKDKNGVEIYEYMEIDNKYEVSFSNGCYVLNNISNSDIIPLYNYIKENNGKVSITKEYTKI